MDKKFNLGFVVCMIIGSIILAGCASARSIAQDVHLIPTPEGAISVPPCDEPTWVVGEQEVCRFLVTPLPDEKVHIGTITEFVPLERGQRQFHYTIVEDTPNQLLEPGQSVRDVPVRKLYVQDTVTGEQVRLGDDAGDAFFQVMTDQYVIWKYQWNGWAETTRKTGLYAHVLETGKEIIIAQEPDQPAYPEIDGSWVIYVKTLGARDYFIDLYAFNLDTGENLLVGDGVPYNRPFNNRPSSDYYAISDDKIAWIDGSWVVNIYDLTARTTRTLNIPDAKSSAVNVSIFAHTVVWWDRFWHGYDLQQDATFTIPTVPPGWENISVQPASPVTVKDDQLYWALEVNREVYRFTAPIIRSR